MRTRGPRATVWVLTTLAAAALFLFPVPHSLADEAPLGPQNDVASYNLHATLDVASKQVHGDGTITYRNPSQDALEEIWLRVYLNAFRSDDTQWMREAGDAHRGQAFDPSNPGWIRVEELRIADSGESLALPDGGDTDATIMRVPLPRPLAPGDTLRLSVRWISQLPRVFARTGFAGDFFMVGQWYPKLAAYDRGRWDTEPWHANAEFFHDFGNYDLAVTVPADFVTGASGVRVGEQPDAEGRKTVRYHADRVTDVAWTAWPQFRAFERQVQAAGQSVQIEALLPPTEAGDPDRHLDVAAAALDAYGRWYGAYPWPKLTLVVPPPDAAGAGGMEYPTLVTTAGAVQLPLNLGAGIREVEITTAHEIAHEWFPMQVQSNESADPWLDEGFADYLTIRFLANRYGAEESAASLPFGHLGYAAIQYASFASGAQRQPLGQAAWQFSDFGTYGATIYSKGSLGLLTLERTLGADRFTSALRAYADTWRWRHPTIADLRAALEGNTGESLGWFFDQFVYGPRVVDYRARLVDATHARIEREGDAAVPVEVVMTFADGTSRVQTWAGSTDALELDGNGKTIVAVAADPDRALALEPDRLDNVRRTAPETLVAAALADRWLGLVQVLLQLVGQIG